jgi:HK97 gp10 family phage protein
MMTINVSFDTHFDSLAAHAKVTAMRTVAKAAFDIQAYGKEFAAKDTGYMANAIYSEQVSEMEWEVISPAFYSVYQEYGTVKMAAHPFMTPAIEIVRPDFERAMGNLL